MVDRTSEEWMAALHGAEREDALADLRTRLVQGLRYALADRPDVSEADIEDLAQDALLRILGGLDAFRGGSHFTTWAQKVAVYVALTELRHRRWRDISLEEIGGPRRDASLIPDMLVGPSAGLEAQAAQHMIWDILRQIINEEWTDTERRALVAARIRGMPLADVAERLGTNRSDPYILLRDARERLKREAMRRGLSSEDVLSAFGQ